MNKCFSRAALGAAAAAPVLFLVPATASAAAAGPPDPGPVHPVVLIGQNQDPLGAFLTCAPTGVIPLFGPNIILPICIA